MVKSNDPEYGKVVRLKPESIVILSKFSADPNIAIGSMAATIDELRGANQRLASEKFAAASAPGAAGIMKEEQLKKLMKEAVTEAIEPFTGRN